MLSQVIPMEPARRPLTMDDLTPEEREIIRESGRIRGKLQRGVPKPGNRGSSSGRVRQRRKTAATAVDYVARVHGWRPVPGGDGLAWIERQWTARLPRAWESVRKRLERGEPVSALEVDVLKAMTAMTPLSPERQRQREREANDDQGAAAPLTELDFSTMSPEVLARVAGRDSAPVALPAPRRRKADSRARNEQ